MHRLASESLFTDPREVVRLQSQIIDGFRQLELEIHQILNQRIEKQLGVLSKDRVPEEFQDRVAEYYRALSKQKAP